MSCDNGHMDAAAVRRTAGVDYGCGRLLDIYETEQPRGSVAVLLWHGSGADERDVLEPLAHRMAAAGVMTIVPDWSRDDGGEGRHHLSASLGFSHDLCGGMGIGRLVLAGWSLGASAGLDVVLLSTILGTGYPSAFIGISGGFDDSPYSQPDLVHITGDPAVPLLLIHGSRDEIVPVERSRSTYQSLFNAGWEVTIREVDADHAGAIGMVYDPDRHRCVHSADPVRQERAATVAGWMAEFALGA
jgi:predicted esterase